MADSDSDSSWNDVIKDWTMVNQFGEVETDELGELTSARSEEDETNLLHSDLSHAELQRSSILETVGDDGAAAAAAADVECETDEGLELMLDQGGPVREENVNSEVTTECEPEPIRDDNEKTDELQSVQHDIESLSSGSSIELLDVSDEGQDHSAIETLPEEKYSDSEKSVEASSVRSEMNQVEMSSCRDVEELTNALHSKMSSSNSTESESSADESGEAENVLATSELDVDSSRVAADVMPSETAEQSFSDDNDAADDDAPVTEACRSGEQSQNDSEVQQSTTTSPSTHRTYDCGVNQAPSSVDEIDLNHDDTVSGRFDEQCDEDAARAEAAQLEKAESDESLSVEPDVSIVSSVNSSDDIDMLPDAQLADGLEDAVEAEAQHVDDRCESDISGIASDDSDLSSMSSGADIAMEMGNVVYCHQPNPVFNTLLTCCTLLMLCFAVGIGVGHYFGSSTMPSLCEQQLHRLRSLQDEQYLCLSNLEHLEHNLQTMSDAEHKLSAVTAVWMRKYEELVKERARLEQSLNVSQQINDKTMEMAADYHIKLNDSQSAVQFLALEVDRLSRELTAANKSLHSSELAAAEWKSKYEAGQVDLRELEQELLSTRAEADEAEQTVDMVQRDVTRLTRDRASSSAAMTALHDEIAALKNVVNQQKLEKAELESIILNQRYSEHPGNVVAPSANISAIYNRETDVSQKTPHHDKDKISVPRATPNSSVDPGHDLSMEFVRLQKHLGRVAMELDDENELQSGGGSAADDKLNVSHDTVFITMLKYVMMSGKQAAGLDLPSQMTSYSRALRRVTDCIEVLDNFTLNHQLAKALMSPWNEVTGYTMMMKGHLSDEVIATFELCRQQFASVVNSKGDTGAEQPSIMDDIFRQYMNKTLEMVSRLSHTVQTTLDRVKTLPEELFAENKTAKKISRKLKEAVGKLNSKVQSGWKHVASKFEDVRKKWFGYSESKKMCKHKKREEKIKYMKKKKHGEDKFPGRPFTKSDEKVDDKKRSYKQTKSATTGKEDGEYGRQKHSDDFLHSSELDDFFEDNHRAWRQHHNRRLRKIGGRIERLNEDMFLSMDDDNVEDIYEDLKDVKEDIEEFDMTDDLWTWMSCQLRWWKTRIHRKHRAEDLVKGCGRQLMHWQLRVLCKQQKHQLSSTLPYCHAVMSAVKPKPIHCRKHPPYDTLLNKLHTSQNLEKTEDLSEMIPVLKNISGLDGGWYFRRVQEREDRRQLSPRWYFDRVEDRQFSRTDANWYVRAMRHNTFADSSYQHSSSGAMKGHNGPN